MPDPASFLSLGEQHRELNELFLDHQEALLGCDCELARTRLGRFEATLLPHMQAEEKWLLPAYQRAGRVLHGAIELFTGEHKRILGFLTRFRVALDALRANPCAPERRIIELFDTQATFKGLLEHHERREEQYLFPTLDRVTTESERRDLLARFRG